MICQIAKIIGVYTITMKNMSFMLPYLKTG